MGTEVTLARTACSAALVLQTLFHQDLSIVVAHQDLQELQTHRVFLLVFHLSYSSSHDLLFHLLQLGLLEKLFLVLLRAIRTLLLLLTLLLHELPVLNDFMQVPFEF